MILATDLDGTFLGGDAQQRRHLYQLLEQHPDAVLIFVTGRGLPSVLPLLEDEEVPVPDYVVADVGGTVVKAPDFSAVEALQNDIDSRWPGDGIIREHFGRFEFLKPQEVPQNNRCSYFAEENRDFSELHELAEQLNCEILFSAYRYLDVLPKGVSKGSTLTRLIELESLDFERVVVAGDTLNDLSMFQIGAKGIVVGNAEDKLKQQIPRTKANFTAISPGAQGIFEGLVYHGLL